MGKYNKHITVTNEDIFNTQEITYELLHKWFVMDVMSMQKLYKPVTKIKALMRIIENNYDRKEIR